MEELKEKIINKIKSIQNSKYLEEIQRVLEVGFEEDVYHLNEEQVALLEEARDEFKTGNFISNEEAHTQVQEWLRKR